MLLKNLLEGVINLNNGNNKITIRSSAAEYLTYVAAVGDSPESIEMRYEDENIWLTQRLLSTLYNVNLATINEHIKNIYNDNELEEIQTIRKFRIVQNEGNRQVLSIHKRRQIYKLYPKMRTLPPYAQLNF